MGTPISNFQIALLVGLVLDISGAFIIIFPHFDSLTRFGIWIQSKFEKLIPRVHTNISDAVDALNNLELVNNHSTAGFHRPSRGSRGPSLSNTSTGFDDLSSIILGESVIDGVVQNSRSFATIEPQKISVKENGSTLVLKWIGKNEEGQIITEGPEHAQTQISVEHIESRIDDMFVKYGFLFLILGFLFQLISGIKPLFC